MSFPRQISSLLGGLILTLVAVSCGFSSRPPKATAVLTLPAGLEVQAATTVPVMVTITSVPVGIEGPDCTSIEAQPETCALDSTVIAPTASPSSQVLGPDRTAPAARTPTPLSQVSPTPCPPGLCIYSSPFLLQRPIMPPGRDSIDFSYRFGSTQGGLRDPHHGVEFLNASGTPVLAAADGLVVIAGDDRQVFHGPYSYFYGNLVVVQHTLPGLPQPFYTLYGHLSEISVQEGEQVQAGQELGRVGMTGVATGSHLHFEVRLGENTYASSRNPELWLEPQVGEDGLPLGALAGRVVDARGQNLSVSGIVLEHLPTPDQPAAFEIYLDSYAEKTLIGQPPYQESFAAGSLPAGWYRVSFAWYGLHQHEVQVLPGQLTVATFRVEE